MPKGFGPGLFLDSRGSIGKTITFQGRPSGPAAIKYSKPGSRQKFVESPAQRHQRTLTALFVFQWQTMTTAEKLVYENLANSTGQALTGYSYFLRKCNESPILHHGLCGYWAFDEPIGATIADLSGNQNHGTLSPNYPIDCPSRIESVNQKLIRGLNFDGIDDTLECGQGESLDVSGPITLELWYKPVAVTSTKFLLSRNLTTLTNMQYGLAVDNLTRLRFYVAGNLWAPVFVFNPGIWYHVCLIYNNPNWNFFVNGASKQTRVSAKTQFSIDCNFVVGAYCILNNGRALWGPLGIDELRIYNRALTSTEVLKHANLYSGKYKPG